MAQGLELWNSLPSEAKAILESPDFLAKDFDGKVDQFNEAIKSCPSEVIEKLTQRAVAQMLTAKGFKGCSQIGQAYAHKFKDKVHLRHALTLTKR
jgi:hypothetical protein